MKQISTAELHEKHAHRRAIFFTKEGKVIVEKDTFLLPVATTLDRLGIPVQDAYHDEQVLIVQLNEGESLFDSSVNVISPREAFLLLPDQPERAEVLLRASHWIVAHGMLQFCSRCGASLEKVLETTEKKCTQCERSFFPKLSPAILVLIRRGEEILLARGAQHPPGMYSVLAGFIDLGEAAEQTVHREVREEVGLEVTNVNYFGSQSWPFPDSFMIAFTADYLRGEIKIDPSELEEARWFHRDELPLLPPPSTLSRRLIEDFLKRSASQS
ncbi:MAG: NAD(+) diphosphatase [Chthoniobacterales bacterium]|nr:NAD(+) diphosphatase [Chthoniobacterales bacterium]